VLVALAGAGRAAAAPSITGVRLAAPAVAGEEAALVVRAVDPDAAISGFAVLLPDGRRFGESACRPSSSTGAAPGDPFGPGDPVRFTIRPTFASVGVSVVNLSVVSGGCEQPGASVQQPLTVTVTLPGQPLVPLVPGLPVVQTAGTIPLPSSVTTLLPGRRAGTARPVVVATAAAAKKCKGANSRPWVGGLPLARRATLCLINRERSRRGLKPVHTDRLLKRAASAFATRMVADGFFAHVGPDGVSLVDRVQKVGWPSRPGDWRLGENLGYGSGVLATPKAIVRAWMESTGHRENLLDKGFDRIGLAIALGTPGDKADGATFATDYGQVG